MKNYQQHNLSTVTTKKTRDSPLPNLQNVAIIPRHVSAHPQVDRFMLEPKTSALNITHELISSYVEIETICSNRSLLPQDKLHYSPNGRAQTPLGSKRILGFINCKEASISWSQSESVVSFTSIPAAESERRLLKLARCISLTSACTTSDIGGRNSGSGWHTPQGKTTKYIRRHFL